MNPDSEKRVAVIGAGVSGLVAARHLADPAGGFSFVLFEQSGAIGGTWVYSKDVGTDLYGLPIHSSMYKNLRTNLPKEAMMFPDFPHTKQGVSYLTAKDILQYLKDYANYFNIFPFIKFHHHVKKILPIGNKWEVHVIDLKSQNVMSYTFDAVMICNGHNSKPNCPTIKGIECFKGKQTHSHDYREPEAYRNQRVLLIGAGPSGLDLAFDISTVTDLVILSHHTNYASKVGLPQKVILKPDVSKVLENGDILFEDGTVHRVDVIIFCTGYLFSYPFLTKECGLTIEDNYVFPLYKHLVNINKPTMAMIGIIKHTPSFYTFDIQVRFFLQSLKHPEGLISKLDMLKELHQEIRQKVEKGLKKRDFHLIGADNEEYINQLSQLGGFPSIPRILLHIYFHAYDKIFSDFKNFRNNFYRILDEKSFTVVDLREIQNKPVKKICCTQPFKSHCREKVLVQSKHIS